MITSAALIMVFVFSSFILNGNPTVKQFGVGMAAAIAVDATIVRCLLVPAVMMLLGRANWWLPGWMERILPRVGLETEDALPPLSERKAALARAAASPTNDRVSRRALGLGGPYPRKHPTRGARPEAGGQ